MLSTLTFAVKDLISGENKHYGTPTNPLLPSCIPGVSSSGSAVAVAAGLVDFAIGWFARDPYILHHSKDQLADVSTPRIFFTGSNASSGAASPVLVRGALFRASAHFMFGSVSDGELLLPNFSHV